MLNCCKLRNQKMNNKKFKEHYMSLVSKILKINIVSSSNKRIREKVQRFQAKLILVICYTAIMKKRNSNNKFVESQKLLRNIKVILSNKKIGCLG